MWRNSFPYSLVFSIHLFAQMCVGCRSVRRILKNISQDLDGLTDVMRWKFKL